MTSVPPPGGDGAPWWRDAVVYEVYLPSFADSDGDGIGDLRGLRERLGHVAELGADALWVTPFYPSPKVDGGYDIIDHRGVDPVFGDLDDVRALLETAHGLGLKVMFDIVPNHTSDRHPWFQEALAASPGSRARARYHFLPGQGDAGELPPNNWLSLFGGPAWTRVADRDGTPGQWYLHVFHPQQPDLNWDNIEVREEYASILRFWLALGADGLRIDFAPGLVKAAGYPSCDFAGRLRDARHVYIPYRDQDGVHEIYREWRKILDEYGAMAVCENYLPAERQKLYVRPDEMAQSYGMELTTADWEPAVFRAAIDATTTEMRSVGAPAVWALGSHDAERQATRYGGGTLGLRRARAAALLLLALPGSTYLYQGEELGLEQVAVPDEARADTSNRMRDGARVPLPWTADGPAHGFSPTGRSWLPQPADWTARAVQAQTGDPGSTLELYRSALRLRRDLPGLGDGTLEWLDGPAGTLCFARPGFVCTVNMSTHSVRMVAPGRLLLASREIRTAFRGTVCIPGDSAAWWCTDT